MTTQTPTSRTTDDREHRRKGLIAWGALAGVAALVTTAAFTDVAHLTLGAGGIGGSDSTYNIQVGATNAAGEFTADWQEADAPAGVPIALAGARSIFPGAGPVKVRIPVRNDSGTHHSSLALTLAENTAGGRVTDPDYLSSLRFNVTMTHTSLSPTMISAQNLTMAEVQALKLNQLAAGEASAVTLYVRLLTQSDSGATFDDNSLSGKGAYLNARLDGSSI